MTVAGRVDEQQPLRDDEAPRTSIEDHQQTFDAFMGLTRWAIIVVAIVLIGLAVFLL